MYKLKGFFEVDVVDLYPSAGEGMHEDGIEMAQHISKDYDAIVLAVEHKEYKEMGEEEWEKMANGDLLLFDNENLFKKYFYKD